MSHRTTRGSYEPLRPYLQQIEATPLLTAEQERELARRIADGDPAARDHLVRANLRLVVTIARRYLRRGLALEDLIAEGNLGLIHAAEAFDGTRGVRFSTFAAYWIEQSMRGGLQKQANLVRFPAYAHTLLAKWRRAAAALATRLGREPAEEEVAGVLGLSARKLAIVREAMKVGAPLGPPGTNEGDPVEVGEITDGRSHDPTEVLGAAEEQERLSERLGRLEERSAKVVRLRFGLGDDGRRRTLEEVGNELGQPREVVRRLEREALQQLRMVL